jgi:hypothetical protein
LQSVLQSRDDALLADVSRLVRAHIVEVQPLGTSRLPISSKVQLPTVGPDPVTVEMSASVTQA